MGSFLRSLIVFLIPVVVLATLVEARLDRVPSPFTRIRDSLERDGARARLLLVGTSRSVGIASPPGSTRAVINAAVPLQSVTVGAQLVENVRPRLPFLEVVLMEISEFSLDHRLTREGSRQNFFYHRTLGVPGDQSFLDRLDLRNYSYFFLYGRETSLELLFGEPVKTADPSPVAAESAEVEASRGERLRRPGNREIVTDSLRALARSLRRDGLPLALFAPPVTAAYREAIARLGAGLPTDDIAALARTEGMAWIDLSSDSEFIASDFLDADHLSAAGAAKLSKRLLTVTSSPRMVGSERR